MARGESVGSRTATRRAVDANPIDPEGIERRRRRVRLLCGGTTDFERSSKVSRPGPPHDAESTGLDGLANQRDLVEATRGTVHPENRRTLADAKMLHGTGRGARDHTMHPLAPLAT